MRTPKMHVPATVKTAKESGLSTATYRFTYDADVQVEAWYDRYQKVWVIYRIDGEGHQVGESTHAYDRGDMLLDVEWHIWSALKPEQTLDLMEDAADGLVEDDRQYHPVNGQPNLMVRSN